MRVQKRQYELRIITYGRPPARQIRQFDHFPAITCVSHMRPESVLAETLCESVL